MNKVVPTKAEIALPELLNAVAKNPVAELQRRPATTTLKVELMRIAQIKLRLRDLGAKPCHEDRLLRGWIQTGTYSDSISNKTATSKRRRQHGQERAEKPTQFHR
jgi:hypothetical protein